MCEHTAAQGTHASVSVMMMAMIITSIYQTILVCQALCRAQYEHYLESLPCPHKIIYYYINCADEETETQKIM